MKRIVELYNSAIDKKEFSNLKDDALKLISNSSVCDIERKVCKKHNNKKDSGLKRKGCKKDNSKNVNEDEDKDKDKLNIIIIIIIIKINYIILVIKY